LVKKKKDELVPTEEPKNKFDQYLQNAKKSFNSELYLGDSEDLSLKIIPSGIQALDSIIKGGFRRGSLTVVNGAFSTGKTFLVYHTIKTLQQSQDAICVLIDAERRFDTKKLIVHRPDSGEHAFEQIYYHLKNGADLIAVDSFALFLPSAMAEQDELTPTIGLQARLMSQGLMKMLVTNKNSVVLATNQLRADIGTRFHPGIVEKMTGGNAQYFNAASIIQTRRRGFLVDRGDEGVSEEEYARDSKKDYPKVGFIMECLLTKCNYAPPQSRCQVHVNFISGQVDNLRTIVDIAVDRDIIKQTSSAWYEYGEERLQGRQNLYDWFKSHLEDYETVKGLVVNG
jgi:recombination protein RecA